MIEIILLILASLSIFKTKKWLNPASVLLILWFIIIKLSRMRLYGLNATDEKYYYFIFLGLLSFVIGFLITDKRINIKLSNNRNIEQTSKNVNGNELNYRVCYIALVCSILITIYKLHDLGFNFSAIMLYGELNRVMYGSKIANLLYEFVAYPLFNAFVCVTVVDFFFGKRDRTLIILTAFMCFVWMLISGGRIAIIRLLISIIVCMDLVPSKKRILAKLKSNLKFLVICVLSCAILVYFTLLKGFEPIFNFYTDFAIQPKMFEYWSNQISGQYAYGSASLFGFIYPFLYVIKNTLGLEKIPVLSSVYDNIQSTFDEWIVLGTYFRCNAYTSCFWYLYYDGRIFGIILGMFLWGLISRQFFNDAKYHIKKSNIARYVLLMIGIIYSFTDMEFWKSNYVLAFVIISKVCYCKIKIMTKGK